MGWFVCVYVKSMSDAAFFAEISVSRSFEFKKGILGILSVCLSTVISTFHNTPNAYSDFNKFYTSIYFDHLS